MALRYKVDGYAQTRDAIVWITSNAPKLDFGLTLDEGFAGLDHGYQSVRAELKDAERIAQWEVSHQKMQEAHALFKKGDVHNGKRTLQQAEELFTTLRRIKGKKVSRQALGNTENGVHEIDD